MCGLAGALTPDRPLEPTELRAMAAALAHRGPDDEGFYAEGPVALVHRRLAILDPSPAGRQPLANEDGSVVVAYNGQLYGFAPLRERLESLGHRFRSRTDTEILVHLYEERGEEMVEDIDGMFAFALWDARRRRLLLARDRLGIKPLHYVRAGERLAFASELDALLALEWVPRRLDTVSLVQYLYQSSVPGDRVILEGHHKLAPGELLVAEGGSVRTRRYWSPPGPRETRPESLEAAAAGLAERLEAAVATHLVADVPVGCFLSGGLDSTAVVRAARRHVAEPLQTFSVRFSGPAGFDEGPAARQVADALGTTHHELELGPDSALGLTGFLARLGEPFAISSAFALHELARFARERVKVVLTGDGADETLAGYPWRHEPEWGPGARPGSLLRGLGMTWVRSWRGAKAGPGLAEQLTARLRRFGRPDARYAEIVSAFTPEEMQALLAPDLAPLAARSWEDHPVRRAVLAAVDPDPVNRRLRVDLATTLVDEMLTKVDRATMAVGLEARVPFLDRGLLEWALVQPGSHKLRSGEGKLLLRHSLRRDLPAAARRPKHGFDVPLGAWFRGSLREQLQDVLSPSRTRRRGILRPEAVERLLGAHLTGRADLSRQLLSLVVAELWLDARSV
jgi:asparagine synthase (glutamine-hydrolysing)